MSDDHLEKYPREMQVWAWASCKFHNTYSATIGAVANACAEAAYVVDEKAEYEELLIIEEGIAERKFGYPEVPGIPEDFWEFCWKSRLNARDKNISDRAVIYFSELSDLYRAGLLRESKVEYFVPVELTKDSPIVVEKAFDNLFQHAITPTGIYRLKICEVMHRLFQSDVQVTIEPQRDGEATLISEIFKRRPNGHGITIENVRAWADEWPRKRKGRGGPKRTDTEAILEVVNEVFRNTW